MIDNSLTITDMTTLSCEIGNHRVDSVVADDESDRQRARALEDLKDALPGEESLNECGAAIDRLATTPDFHPGRPVPVGVVVRVSGAVLPHLVGNDIGCGMRLTVLEGVTPDEVMHCLALDQHLRHILFQGGRDIALTGRMRRALLENGLIGFYEEVRQHKPPGLLSGVDIEAGIAELDRTSDLGSFDAGGVDPNFEAIAPVSDEISRDAILGSLGGGNHFLEIGYVDRLEDGSFARASNIKMRSTIICVHSGSLGFGQRVSATITEALRSSERTVSDKRILPFDDPLAARYLTGLANACNAAFGNRLLLTLAAVEAIKRATKKDISPTLIYDAPHNMAWHGGDYTVHRKGSCPARDGAAMTGTPYAYHGEPVILPGSMGDGTWLLAGKGSDVTLASSAHGAGRRLSRSQARRGGLGEIEKNKLRVVGPVDLNDPQIKGRPDVLDKVKAHLAEEAPNAYRPIDTVVEPMVRAGLVTRVAKIRPILTAKG